MVRAGNPDRFEELTGPATIQKKGTGTPAPPESCYFPCALQESNLNAVMRVLQLKLPLVL